MFSTHYASHVTHHPLLITVISNQLARSSCSSFVCRACQNTTPDRHPTLNTRIRRSLVASEPVSDVRRNVVGKLRRYTNTILHEHNIVPGFRLSSSLILNPVFHPSLITRHLSPFFNSMNSTDPTNSTNSMNSTNSIHEDPDLLQRS